MMYLLTERPLSAEALAWEEAPGIGLSLEKTPLVSVPRKVSKISHGAIYYVRSSKGCGCGFEEMAYLPPEDDEYQQWQAEMHGLERLLRRIAQEQPAFQLCTGWDFEEEVTPRCVTVGEIVVQQFDEEWDWLQVTR